MKRKVPESLKFKDYLITAVELEGIEPSSAQENHMLSTCLFLPSIFEVWQDLEHQQYRLSTFSAKKV